MEEGFLIRGKETRKCYLGIEYIFLFPFRLKSSRNVTRLICKKEFHFCCKLRPSDKNLPFPTEHPFKTSTTPISSTIRTTSTSSSSARTTSTPSSSTTTPFRTTTQSPPLTTKCGIQRPTFDDRILTTEPSTIPGEFPWMVAIVIKKSNYEFKCAGSIVHPRVILTASHCVRRFVFLNYILQKYNNKHFIGPN